MIPATLALVLTALGLSIALVPTDFERRLQTLALRHGRVGRIAQRLATIPATASAGMRDALAHVRTRDPALLGAIVFWGCQIGCLWASFRAFGQSPAFAVIVIAFFVGMLGNLLPLPGGIGGVDGGMIGAFAAFNVDTGLAWSRCSSTAPSRSGCRPFRASSPTCSCARPSSVGAASARRYTIQTEVRNSEGEKAQSWQTSSRSSSSAADQPATRRRSTPRGRT